MVKLETVDRAVAEIKRRWVNYEYFFERLDSPDWVRPLHERGFFQEPPSLNCRGDSISFPIWPESRYLVRIAGFPGAQQEILQIFLALPETENPRVAEDLADAALVLPGSMASQLVPKAVSLLKSPYRLLLPEKLANLTCHLLEAGEVDSAFTLAAEILRIDVNVNVHQQTWEYDQLLIKMRDSLRSASGARTVELLSDLLEQAILSAGVSTPPRDHSWIWRPAIEDHAQNRPSSDIRGLLVVTLRDVAEVLAREDGSSLPGLVGSLESRAWYVFGRISLHLMRVFRNLAVKYAPEKVLEWAKEQRPELHHEQYLLAGAVFPHLDRDVQDAVLREIASGPDLLVFRKRKEERTGTVPSAQDLEEYRQAWQLGRLIPFAQDLPTDWKVRFERWVEQYGVPEHPSFLSYSTSWRGPTSPRSAEEMSRMDVEDLVEFLRTWEPSGQHWSPSPSGLSRQITTLVASAPERFCEGAHRFAGLRPAYVRAIFEGFREAVGKGTTLEWDHVLDLAGWVLEQPREPQHYRPAEDDDPDWGWARTAIARLLAAGLERSDNLPIRFRTRVWEVLGSLTSDPDPTSEVEDRFGMDPLSVAMNTTRGEAIHAAIIYGRWVRSSQDKWTGFTDVPELREVLDEHLDPKRDPSPAIRSVFGRWYPILVALDEEWASESVTRVFPRDEGEQRRREAAWHTYLSCWSSSTRLFQLLRSEYESEIERLSETQAGGSIPDHARRLANHLVERYWAGEVNPEVEADPFRRFYEVANPELRAHVIEMIGRSLHSDLSIKQKVIDKSKRLWGLRLETAESQASGRGEEFDAELKAFGYWYGSGKFEDDWSMAQLRRVLRRTKRIDAEYWVGPRLIEASSADPHSALECLKLLTEGAQDWKLYRWIEHGRAILRTALASSSKEVRELATDLVNRLGARGYKDLRSLVKPRE